GDRVALPRARPSIEQRTNQRPAARRRQRLMSENAIVADGLLKRFGDLTALRDVSFEVPRGTITGFVGRNGAGKTTTLKIVSTLMRADDGTCQVLGYDVRREPYAIRSRIGFLPDMFDLPAVLTLREYLGVFTELYGIPRGDRS